MRLLTTAVMLIGLVVLAGLPRAGSPRSGGTITGRVVSIPDSHPMPDAMVEVRSKQAGLRIIIRTDETGHYRLERLAPGIDYVIRVSSEHQTYASIIQDRVVVRAGLETVEHFGLFPFFERITVDGRASLIDLMEIGQKTVLDGEFIRALPTTCNR